MTVMEAFEAAAEFTKKHEGGYANDPDDAGGETKFGISKASHPYLDIKNLTWVKVKPLYYKDYWRGMGLDDLVEMRRPLFAIACFDTAFNHGPATARKLAQKAAGATPDGIWGPLTKKAFRERDDILLVEMLCFYRRQRYRDIVSRKPSQGKFLRGWMRRVDELQEYVRGL